MINVHAIANRVIRSIHPNETFIVVRSIGYQNNYGVLTYEYGNCEQASGQMQSLNGDEQKLANEIAHSEISRKLFISVSGSPLTAGRFDTQEGATFLYQVSTGDFWKVFNVSEDFSKCTWATVFISLMPWESSPIEVRQALKASSYGNLVKDKEIKPNVNEPPSNDYYQSRE